MGRRKKNKKPEKQLGLKELSGYSTGQEVYCFRHPDKMLARGKIKFLFKTKAGEFAEFVDDITGQFRATLLEDIIAEPSRSQINSANSKIAKKFSKPKDKK